MSRPIKPNPIPEYLKGLPGRTLITADEVAPWFNFASRNAMYGSIGHGFFPKPDAGQHSTSRKLGVLRAPVNR